jgi:hypothetical protein
LFLKLFYIFLWFLNILDKILVNIIKMIYKLSTFLFTYLQKIYFKLIFWLSNNGSEIFFFLAYKILIIIGNGLRLFKECFVLLIKFVLIVSFFCNKTVFIFINPFINVGKFASIVGSQPKLNFKEKNKQKLKIKNSKKSQRIYDENKNNTEYKKKYIVIRRKR